MPSQPTSLNAIVGQVVQSEHQKVGLTGEGLAYSIDMPLSTLRKKLAGRSPLHVDELIAIAQVIGEVGGHDWRVIAQRIVDDAQRIWELVSEDPATTDDLQKRREKQERARSMTTEELEDQERRAAATDPEFSADEPDTP